MTCIMHRDEISRQRRCFSTGVYPVPAHEDICYTPEPPPEPWIMLDVYNYRSRLPPHDYIHKLAVVRTYQQ